MKTRVALVLGMLAAGPAIGRGAEDAAASANETTAPTSIQSALSDAIKRDHRYDPAIRQRELADVAAAGDVVKMDPFEVTERKDLNRLDRNLRARREMEAKAGPSVANGVTVPGFPNAGIIPYKDEMPFGPPKPRWTLLQIPW